MHSVTPGWAASARVVSSSSRAMPALAESDRRGFVVDPDENELAHGAPNL